MDIERIWFIDDNAGDVIRLQKILKSVNKNVDVRACSAFSTEEELKAALPASKDMNRVELAFVDLELIKEREILKDRIAQNLRTGDSINVSGGSIVLPHLRKHAPWVAVVALSDYISEDCLRTTPTIGCYPFDGIMTKASIIGKSSFHYEQWSNLCERWRKNTFERITQRSWLPLDALPQISWEDRAKVSVQALINDTSESRALLSPERDRFLANTFEHLEETLRQAFSFASTIAIISMVPGLSGASVFKVRCARPTSDGIGDSEWVLKLSPQSHKLWREVQAHRDVILSGIDAGVTVPLLYNGVITSRGVGMIAYQFAKHQGTLNEVLKGDVDPASQLNILAESITRLYQKPSRNGIRVGDICREYLKPKKFPRIQVRDRMCDDAEGIICSIYKCSPNDLAITQRISCLWTLIHGDLHGRNILAGRLCTLIDFSDSKAGPIAVDMAKLVADLFIECPKMFTESVSYDDLMKAEGMRSWFSKLMEGASDGDILLFNMLLVVFLAQARGYYDVLRESQVELRRIESAISLLDQWIGQNGASLSK